MNSGLVKNLLLEAARLVVFGIPAILIYVVGNDPNAAVWGGGIILTTLKAIDRAIHEDQNIPAKGLLPF